MGEPCRSVLAVAGVVFRCSEPRGHQPAHLAHDEATGELMGWLDSDEHAWSDEQVRLVVAAQRLLKVLDR